MEINEKPSKAARAPSPILRPLTIFEQINMNLFWFANQFHWQALLAVVIPSMVAHLLDPRLKEIHLSMVVTLGTVVALVVNPLAGAISDYARFRMGRRRPFLIMGTILNVVVLVIFAFAPSWFASNTLLVAFVLLFLLLQFSNNLTSPWSAIIADNVPSNQRGQTSGFNSLLNLLGTALGGIVAGAMLGGALSPVQYRSAIVQIFLLIALVQSVVVAVSVLMVKETPLAPDQQRPFLLGEFLRSFFFKPSRYPDLSWVLLARFLVMMGIWSVFYFLVYFFQDVLGGPGVKTILFNTPFTGEQFNGVLFQPAILLAALPTSMIAGWLSDRHGRKGAVYLSGAMMAIVCLLFSLFQNQYMALLGGVFFGIAYGAYTSVDWALTADVLPQTDEAGKFMGLWAALSILPQVMATAVSGVVLQALKFLPHHLNYTLLFMLTIVYLVLGTVVISRVKGVR